jgi:hypothetical protein
MGFFIGETVKIDSDRHNGKIGNIVASPADTTYTIVIDGEQIDFDRIEFAPLSDDDRESLMVTLTSELLDIMGGGESIAVVRAAVEKQVAIAGVPENGAGMAAAHEWSDRQIALLESAGAL